MSKEAIYFPANRYTLFVDTAQNITEIAKACKGEVVQVANATLRNVGGCTNNTIYEVSSTATQLELDYPVEPETAIQCVSNYLCSGKIPPYAAVLALIVLVVVLAGAGYAIYRCKNANPSVITGTELQPLKGKDGYGTRMQP